MSNMSENLWYKVARRFIKAGRLPIPVTDSVIKILQAMLNEEQAQFTLLLKKPSYNIDQLKEIKEIREMGEDKLNNMLQSLMHAGVMSAIPSRSTGVMVYRLLPFLPGLVETTFMKGGTGEREKKLARLYEDFFNELVQGTQKNYDTLIPAYKDAPSIARVIPVEEEIEVKKEVVLPFDELSKILDNYDTIGLATCYCRHRKDLLGEPCKITDERKNCFSFGRTAVFMISQGFAEEVSKEDAMKILKKAEDEGLVHKAFHANLDINKEIDGLCNCCKCCCGTFEAHYAGALPLTDYSSYLARVNEDDCIGCGTCVENCNAEAIDLIDTIAQINEDRCIGCGVCAHVCPENAMRLERVEPRKVFVPPPKLENP